MGIAIEIEGVDKTSSCLIKQLSISDELNSRNTYGFGLVSTDGSYRPAVGNDAIVYAAEHYSDSRDIGDATFTRASVAVKLDGTEVASGEARYETGQYSSAITVEEGTTNLLTANQSDVETDTTGFVAFQGTETLTKDTNEHWQGLADLKVVTPGGVAVEGFRTSSTNVSASLPYTISVWLKGTGTVYLVLSERNNGDSAIGTTVLEDIVLTGTWTRYSVTRTFGLTGVKARLSVLTQDAAQAITFYADGLQLEQKDYATSWIEGGVTRVTETLTIPTAGVLNETGPWTIECWAKFNTESGTHRMIFSAWEKFYVSIETSNKPRLSWVDGTQQYVNASSALTNVTNWHFWSFTWTGTVAKVYVDGVKVIETSTTFPDTLPAVLDIGRLTGGGYNCDGIIDDLRISNIARTDAEILADYNSGTALSIDEWTTAKLSFDDTLQINARPILFAGTIDSLEENSISNGKDNGLFFNCACVDYNQLCDRFLIAQVYESNVTGDIVKDFIDNFINITSPGESVTYTNVDDGPTITKAVFNYTTTTQALDELSEISGYVWYIDYSKDMHFHDRLKTGAPFSLTDSSNNFRNLVVRRNRNDYRNKQYFRGGKDISSAQTESFVGDGTRRTFTLSLPCAKVPTSVTVNAVAKTIGIYQVETGKDFYWQEDSFNITQDSGGAVLTSIDTLAVTYQGYFPIIYENFLESAISERQSVEGGTGIYESVVTDQSINTSDAVAERTSALLRKYGTIPEIIEFETDNDGLKSGQLITITLTKHSIDSAYLIQRVTIQDITQNILRYRVTALSGENIGGWVDFFKKLAKAGQTYTIRENEVLLKIRNFSDNLRLTDILTATSGSPIAIVNISQVGFCEVG